MPPGWTIYVVDDDEAVRHSLSWLAESAGWTVRAFRSAESFLDSAPPSVPACLLLDVRLPGMDGLELLRVLAARGRAMPTVVLSAESDEHLRETAPHQGAVTFLSKPCDEGDLLRAIERALRQWRRPEAALVEAEEVRRRLSRLTPREREVLNLLLAGKTSREIAAELGVMLKTVTLYRSRLNKMLGVRDVEGLARLLEGLSRQDKP